MGGCACVAGKSNKRNTRRKTRVAPRSTGETMGVNRIRRRTLRMKIGTYKISGTLTGTVGRRRTGKTNWA